MQADFTRATAMGLAFVNAAVKRPKDRAAKAVFKALDKPFVGVVRERAVNCNLSFRTATKLKQEGTL